jgi:hypothetical protein
MHTILGVYQTIANNKKMRVSQNKQNFILRANSQLVK